VKMNFDLTPTSMAMLRKCVNDLCIVMFCSIEIRMLEWGRASVAPAVEKLWISLTPILDAEYLFRPRSEVLWHTGRNIRFKVISDGYNQMEWPRRRLTNSALPAIGRGPLERAHCLYPVLPMVRKGVLASCSFDVSPLDVHVPVHCQLANCKTNDRAFYRVTSPNCVPRERIPSPIVDETPHQGRDGLHEQR